MIQINKQYAINPSKRSYDLVHFTTDKAGKQVAETLGYYHDFNAALKGYIKIRARRKLSQKDMSVVEAIKEIESIRDEVKSILDGGDSDG